MGLDAPRVMMATEVTGIVVERLPNAMFRIELDATHQVLAHLADTRRRNFIRILTGDRVRVELSPHDRTRGRITERLSGGN